ncbi:unnamed protein product [Effrenium voratum]|nr:unnamed protein product [Effrenium voratum]
MRSAHGHVFEKYCGHEVHWAEPPVTDYELLLVQVPNAAGRVNEVVHRHGARNLWAPLGCWAPAPKAAPAAPELQCRLPFGVSAGHGRHRLTKRYLTPGHCGFGSLLGEAEVQFRNLAGSLNASYGQVPWWKTLDVRDASVRLYSCDNERNLGSLDLLMAKLFPSNYEASVDTLPPEEDPFQLPGFFGVSPCDGSPLPALQEIEDDKDFRAFAERWLRRANVTWNHMLYDCILTARCAGASLPPAIEEVADEALLWGYRQQLAAVYGSNWTTWAVQPALHAIALEMQTAAQVEVPRLAVWSTHDSTMIYLLKALQAWDGVWPGYASAVVLELYRGPEGPLVRLLRDGRPVTMGACEVLCPLARFLRVVADAAAPCTFQAAPIEGASHGHKATMATAYLLPAAFTTLGLSMCTAGWALRRRPGTLQQQLL